MKILKHFTYCLLLLLAHFSEAATAKIPISASENTLCDSIFFKNGDTIVAKVSEIGTRTITYKRCGRADDPDFVVKKKAIYRLKNAQGELLIDKRKPLSFDALTLVLFCVALGIGGFWQPYLFIFTGLGLLILSIYISQKPKKHLQKRRKPLYIALFSIFMTVVAAFFLFNQIPFPV